MAILKRTKNRDTCEDKIEKQLLAIKKIYEEYHPTGRYLTMTIKDGDIFVNNAYWEKSDKDYPIEFHVIDGEKGSVYG